MVDGVDEYSVVVYASVVDTVDNAAGVVVFVGVVVDTVDAVTAGVVDTMVTAATVVTVDTMVCHDSMPEDPVVVHTAFPLSRYTAFPLSRHSYESKIALVVMLDCIRKKVVGDCESV